MAGLVPEDDQVKVLCQKNRDGRRPEPFLIEPRHDNGTYHVTFVGERAAVQTDKQGAVLSSIRPLGSRSLADVVEDTGLPRTTVRDAIDALCNAGKLIDTGEKKNKSPIYRVTEP